METEQGPHAGLALSRSYVSALSTPMNSSEPIRIESRNHIRLSEPLRSSSSYLAASASLAREIIPDGRCAIVYSDSNLLDVLRLRLALSLKAVEYRLCRIDLNSNEHRSDDYRRLNPSDSLPLLMVGSRSGARLSISNMPAILEFIDDHWSCLPRLMPRDAFDRARIRMLVSRMIGHQGDINGGQNEEHKDKKCSSV